MSVFYDMSQGSQPYYFAIEASQHSPAGIKIPVSLSIDYPLPLGTWQYVAVFCGRLKIEQDDLF